MLFALVWNDATVNRLQLVVAVSGLALLAWGYSLAQKGQGHRHQKLRDRLLISLGLVGGLAYPNFGHLHFKNFIHAWDTYHYYIGSKYFPELGYDLLYDCTTVADSEDGFRERAEKRVITDLRTNQMVKTEQILAKPELCKDHFSGDRWASFKRDVAFFRGRVHSPRWDMIQRDHGYNATPVWNVVGHALSNLGPATTAQVVLLNCLDPLLLLGMFGLVFWAFGWRVLAVALLVFGTNFPSRYYWTGGAFLRHDWLACLVACVCLLKKGRPLLAGLAIGYSALLRIFPGFLLVGPLMAMFELFRTQKTLDRRYLRLFAGAALAISVWVPVTLLVSGGALAYQRFAENTTKHAQTPLTNHMGLRTAVMYRPGVIGAILRDGRDLDPWGKWKAARLDAFRQALPVYTLAALAFLVLLYFAVRGAGLEPWVSAALSAGVIAVGAELTSYYYCFLVATALLTLLRREVGLLLLSLTTVTQIIGWAPFPNMSKWDDEQHVAMSIASLVALSGVMWVFTKRGSRHCVPVDT